jgi:hypothetical protein
MRVTFPTAIALVLGCQPSENRNPQATGVVAAPVQAAPITPIQVAVSEPASNETDVAPPFSLTASDGSGLRLTRLDAKAVVQGPLAFTELHLYFRNPESRTREGTFAITLPSGAAVSRFAMEIDGKFQEAEVVEKAVARRVYDDFLHRRQDPALLEKAAGNQFTAKVFPIPANADKHLVISFSQDLPGRGYVLPLRGLPKIDRVDLQMLATQADGSLVPQTITKREWQPDQDFAATSGAVPPAVAAGQVVVAAVSGAKRGVPAPAPPQGITLLVDTSASRALGYTRYLRSLRELVAALAGSYGGALPIQVIAFDQTSQVIYSGAASGYGDPHDKLLVARGAAGASNLAGAITALRSPHPRLVIVTDGVMTVGPETAPLVAQIEQRAFERVDVVLSGGIRDERLATAVARAAAKSGDVLDLDRGSKSVATALGESVLVDVTVEVPGAAWVYPKQIPALRSGASVMVFARLEKPAQSFDVVLGGERTTFGLVSATPALAERAVAAAEIEELEGRLASTTDANAGRELRADIAKRSIRSRVISSQTAMLVLETEDDYARYKIARTSLADILTIGPKGLEQQHRSELLASVEPEPRDEVVDIARDQPMPPAADGTPQLAREQAIELARNAGMLGAGSTPSGGEFASLTGAGDISSGVDDANIYGGLLEQEAGEMQGGFGFGRSGLGPGGGGSGWGTIGTGRYGTIGHGSGTGSGYGIGSGRGGMRGRSSTVPTVRIGQPHAEGDLDKAIIRRYIKRNIQKIQYCYEKKLLTTPALRGTMTVQFVIDKTGNVVTASASGLHAEVDSCVAAVVKTIQFPKPRDNGIVRVSYPFTFSMEAGVAYSGYSGYSGRAERPAFAGPSATTLWTRPSERGKTEHGVRALSGKLDEVMTALEDQRIDKALGIARAWHLEAPGDVLALIALGEVLEAKHDTTQAARIYGSIIDLFPARADMRRFAGERLQRTGQGAAELVVDTYRRAVADRPDHATGHRLLAYALARTNDYRGALAAILAGVDREYPSGRFEGADRILREDAGMIAAAYIAAGGGDRTAIVADLAKRSIELPTGPSTRFIMYWETDANDVDFHINDSKGGHAYYSSRELPSGGELYADITTGYGPECFAIAGTPKAGPYKLSINYFSQGPMGYGMGLLQIQRFDGKSLTFVDRPYVIMTNHAFVDLGAYP